MEILVNTFSLIIDIVFLMVEWSGGFLEASAVIGCGFILFYWLDQLSKVFLHASGIQRVLFIYTIGIKQKFGRSFTGGSEGHCSHNTKDPNIESKDGRKRCNNEILR
jgi:hypothetical protein